MSFNDVRSSKVNQSSEEHEQLWKSSEVPESSFKALESLRSS
jgi:hypothetical protein